MPFQPNFSVAQFSGTPSSFSITDTSIGSDPSITYRRVYLLQANGTFLVPQGTTTDYIIWPLANDTITLDVLTQDSALSITIQWMNALNQKVTDKTNSFAFTAYNETFYYGLSQDLVGNSNLSSSTSWFEWMLDLRVQLDSAQQAISFASDIYTAQAALNRATYISSNSSFFF